MKVGSGTASERRGELAPERAFLGVSALLFFGSAVATVHWYGAMSDSEGMPMPGGWTMSMAWMRPAEQSWLEAGAAFLAMWMVMMLAMMLPSAVLMLLGYRRCVRGSGATHLDRRRMHGDTASAWACAAVAVVPASCSSCS